MSLRPLHLALALVALAGAPALAQRPSGTGFREIEQGMKRSFQRTHPCPVNGKTVGNCPGYQVGYVLHPRNGGKIAEENMRWMTDEEYAETRQEWTPGG